MRVKKDMELTDGLHRFIEHSSSDLMLDLASELLDLLESDAVEPLSSPGRALRCEEVAERLEQRVDRIRRKREDGIDGLDAIEDAVAHLRARESELVAPWTFEDGEGIRWFVLHNEDDDEVVACYTSRPFVEAEI